MRGKESATNAAPQSRDAEFQSVRSPKVIGTRSASMFAFSCAVHSIGQHPAALYVHWRDDEKPDRSRVADVCRSPTEPCGTHRPDTLFAATSDASLECAIVCLKDVEVGPIRHPYEAPHPSHLEKLLHKLCSVDT
ncbi:hypothetical protein MRX96_006930 [Rhipicephalus microplus]